MNFPKREKFINASPRTSDIYPGTANINRVSCGFSGLYPGRQMSWQMNYTIMFLSKCYMNKEAVLKVVPLKIRQLDMEVFRDFE